MNLNSTSAKNIIDDANKENELHERNAQQDSQPDQIRNNRYPISHVDGSAAQQPTALSGNQDQLSEKPLSKMPTVNAQNADADVLVNGVSRAKLIKYDKERKGTDDYELPQGPALKNLVRAFNTSQKFQAKTLTRESNSFKSQRLKERFGKMVPEEIELADEGDDDCDSNDSKIHLDEALHDLCIRIQQIKRDIH